MLTIYCEESAYEFESDPRLTKKLNILFVSYNHVDLRQNQ